MADKNKYGTLILETVAFKKGMSFLRTWQERHLRLYDAPDGGLILAWYKNKDTPKANGSIRIQPHGKVHEIDYAGGNDSRKRKNVLTIEALNGKDFTCSMPDAETRTQWAAVLREEADNATDKGRRLSQSTTKMNDASIAQLTIKVVSHARYKPITEATLAKHGVTNPKKMSKTAMKALLKEFQFGFDFGIYNFSTGKWSKMWSKTMSNKQWEQAHAKIVKSGLLTMFGDSAVLTFPESYGDKKNTLVKKLETRALDIELCLHSIFNMVDSHAIRANAAPWVITVAFPQLHEALGVSGIVAAKLCRLGYRRKCLAFGADPAPKVVSVNDFDIDHDKGVDGPETPTRMEITKGEKHIKKRASKYIISRTKSKVVYKPVVVYSGILWKQPTSGGLGRGRKRWFSLRRTEGGNAAVLEYFEDPDEKRLKGEIIVDDKCQLLLNTTWCQACRYRFCIQLGTKAVEAQAGSEKEFGTWVMHLLRYTYNQNSLGSVTPSSVFEDDAPSPHSDESQQLAAASAASVAATPSARFAASLNCMAPRETPTNRSSESKNKGGAAAAAASR